MNLQEKPEFVILEKEFQELALYLDSKVSKQELQHTLDKKARKQFDTHIVNQLYDRMDKDFQQNITIYEFIKVFFEAEQILKSKIDSCRKQLDDYTRQKREADKKLQEVKKTEKLNNYGVMSDSSLTFNLIQGKNLQVNILNTPLTTFKKKQVGEAQIIFLCGIQRQESIVARGPNPIWKETFIFSIESGMEDLNLTVFDIYQNQFVGSVAVTLNRLKDQQKREEWLDLYNQDGQQIPSQILVQMEWIYSRIKYLSDMVKKLDEQIQISEDDLLDYERDLACLYEPFPALVKYLSDPIVRQQNLTNQNAQQVQDVQQVTLTHDLGEHILVTTRLIIIGLLIVTLLVSFYRTVFFDKWWNGSHNHVVDPEIEYSVRRYTLIMSWLLFVIKIALLYFFKSLADYYRTKEIREEPFVQDNEANNNIQQNKSQLGLSPSDQEYSYQQPQGQYVPAKSSYYPVVRTSPFNNPPPMVYQQQPLNPPFTLPQYGQQPYKMQISPVKFQ